MVVNTAASKDKTVIYCAVLLTFSTLIIEKLLKFGFGFDLERKNLGIVKYDLLK